MNQRSWSPILALAGWLALGSAHAGRPLVVEDAGTNDAGQGHLELWASRAHSANTITVSPAYAVADGVELAASLARTNGRAGTAAAMQVKWRLTPARMEGCNFAAIAAAARESGTTTMTVTGVMTCNLADSGSLHVNAGSMKERRVAAAGTWGIAYERPWGQATAHVEYFGAAHAKPTIQVGLRAEVGPGIQLDGSIGRASGATLFTLGTKVQF